MKKIKEADNGYISLDVQTNDSDYWLSSISYISATKFIDNKITDNLYFPIKDSVQNRSEFKQSHHKVQTFKFAYIELLKLIEDLPVVSHGVNLQKKVLEHYCNFNGLTLFENIWICTSEMLWDAKNFSGNIASCLNELNLKNNLHQDIYLQNTSNISNIYKRLIN